MPTLVVCCSVDVPFFKTWQTTVLVLNVLKYLNVTITQYRFNQRISMQFYYALKNYIRLN
jgi:hypothetical protein